MYYKQIIGFFHIIATLCFAFYGFTKKNNFDYYYVVCMFLLLLSWNFLQGECIITYVVKKIENPNYKLGADILNVTDIQSILFFDYNTLILILLFINFLLIYSLGIVLYRNNYSQLFSILFFLFFVKYFVFIKILALKKRFY
jgi:hypothetical protein